MSSSSNECECDYFQYGGVLTKEMESPWYSTFGQPLIYYSQVQPFHRWQRNKQTEKEKPNYFKRAFRWYTQERKPLINGRIDSSNNMKNNANLKGFAAWLDEKYNEYLQIERSKYILTQTSAVEIDKTINRPWKKRRKYLNDREKGDIVMKSNKSLQIILKPKDLSRPASECCQRTKARSCCNRSNSTVESNASTVRGIAKPKSQSLSSVVQEREIFMIPFDIPDYCANRRVQREYEKSSSRNVPKETSRWNTKKYRSRHHVSCQCSKYKDESVDTHSQFGNDIVKSQDPYLINKVEEKPSLYKRNIEEKKDLVTSEIQTNKAKPKTAECVHKEEAITFTPTSTVAEKNKAAFLASVNDSVQTSDHSINLEQNPEYPLFVKIVREDKLKEC